MLRQVKKELGDDISITWRYFSLEQVNNKNGDDWKLWEQPESYPSRSRLAFYGAEAARKQGDDAFSRFHFELLHLRHSESRELIEKETILDAARRAELDLNKFEQDMDAATLEPIGVDHQEGVENYGIFGTPTFVFDDGSTGYIKLRPVPPEDEILQTWQEISAVVKGRPQIGEIKRPVPPRR